MPDLGQVAVTAAEPLSMLAVLFAVVQVSALVALHVLPTGYDPVRDAVSDYGVGPFRRFFWVQAVAGGLSCLLLGLALGRLEPFTPAAAVVALLVTAAARFVIPFFPTDQSRNRFQTLHGVVHMVLAVLAFGGLVWAATGLWGTLHRYPAWRGLEGVLTIVPWVMLGSAMAVVLAMRGPRLSPYFGLFERLFYLSSLTWIFVVAIELARRSA